jgi:hypothetical protein
MQNSSINAEIILSAGMPRSGSTWLYNAARLLLGLKLPKSDLSSGWVEDIDIIPKGKLLLLKIHIFDERWLSQSSLTLYSYRDVRDALASNKRKFGTEPTLHLAKRFIENDERWRAVSAYNLRYERMIAKPLIVLAELAEVLEISSDCRGILEEINRLDYNDDGPKNDNYHMINLLHRNHITDGRHGSWGHTLDPHLLRDIEQTYYEWFMKNGYPLSDI